MKKRNILISVLLGLVMAFGVLIASCDNGVLPKYERKNDQIEWDLPEEGGYPYIGYDGETKVPIGDEGTTPTVLLP